MSDVCSSDLCHDANMTEARFDGTCINGDDIARCAGIVDLRRARLQGQPPALSRRLPVPSPHDIESDITQHEAWIRSQGRKGRQLRWANYDLSDRDFSGRILAAACITGCLLDRADFTGAVITAATFRDCRFDDAVFQDADMRGTQYDTCDMSRCSFTESTQGSMPELQMSTAFH